jgi:hypothetical protein
MVVKIYDMVFWVVTPHILSILGSKNNQKKKFRKKTEAATYFELISC